jgi:hypothetical protein
MSLWTGWISKPPQGTPLDPSQGLCAGLAGVWVFNEGSGKTAYNIASGGNTNNAIFQPGTASPTWVNGTRSTAIFAASASSQFANAGNIASLSGTFQASMFILGNVASGQALGAGRATTSADFFMLAASAGSVYVTGTMSNGVQGLADFATAPVGDCDMTFVYNGRLAAASVPALYVNGLPKTLNIDTAFNTLGLATSTNGFLIGWDQSDASFTNGRFDAVYLWTGRALSAAEVLSLHENPWQIFAPPLPFWWGQSSGGGSTASLFRPATLSLGAGGPFFQTPVNG